MAQVRSALVIATGDFHDPSLSRLRSPLGDAGAVSRVLSNPAIGGFDVRTALNEPEGRLRRELGRFFADRGRDDLLLLYISCHGVKDERGQLYFAATDTELSNLAATALSAEFINEQVSRSRSRAVVLVLDCCYSGAFPSGMAPKASLDVDLGEEFMGSGRVVIAASGSLEYAFEGPELANSAEVSSVFTDAFVRGLETGEADLNRDGLITTDELYQYIYGQVLKATPHQRPTMMSSIDGAVLIARNPALPVTGSTEQSSPLPRHISQSIEDPLASVRVSVIDELGDLLAVSDPQVASAARQALEQLAQDDSKMVRAMAESALAGQARQIYTEEPSPAVDDVEMKYAPEPIVSNDYWTIGDQLDYEPYAVAISEFIQHEDTRPPLTIGIKAPWGAGKTSLMRMIQDRLDPPGRGGTAIAEPRRRVALTAASRMVLAGWPRWRRLVRALSGKRDVPTVVTNWTLLRKLKFRARQSASTDGPASGVPDGTARLRIDASGLDHWRPTVWFNPWMYQSGEQIWAGLAHEIISQTTTRMPIADREAFWLELNLRRVDANALRRRVHRALFERLLPAVAGLVITAVVTAVVLVFRSIAPGIADSLNSITRGLLVIGTGGAALAGIARTTAFWRGHLAGYFPNLIRQPDYVQGWQRLISKEAKGASAELSEPGYESRLGFLHIVQTDMRRILDLVATRDRPIVVFVDDLDRCSPGAVAQVIEAINLFLAGQFPNCIFIIAMEPEMVAAHIEVVYRPLVDTLTGYDYWGEARTLGWRFLDKIVQLPISLPVLRSDQAGQFLGTALAGGLYQSGRRGDGEEEDLDRTKVSRIEEAIQQSRPSIEDISEAAASAQEQVVGTTVTKTGFSPEAQAAMRRELRRRLRPDNPEIQAIVAAVSGRLSKNPREIKRFVNVFRFYAVIRQEREAAGMPVADTLAEVAKLAVLAVRWPHLRAALGRQIGATERDTVLSLLEAPVEELPGDADWPTRKQALHTVLADARIPEKLRVNLLASEELCQLLACAPSIGTAAAGYL